MTTSARLVIEGVGFRYGRRTILDGLSFDVAAGEIARIAGPNGVGKSTLLDLVAGLHVPARGAIRLDGVDVTSVSLPERARVGIRRMRQRSRLFEASTVAVNLEAPRLLDPRHSRAAPCRPPGWAHDGAVARELSYGWRKVVSFLQTISGEVRVLLLDEPFAGLSSSLKAWMINEIWMLIERSGAAVIVVDHEATPELPVSRVIALSAASELEAGG